MEKGSDCLEQERGGRKVSLSTGGTRNTGDGADREGSVISSGMPENFLSGFAFNKHIQRMLFICQ